MTETKMKYWQEPDWDCLSPRRKYPWLLSDRSDWQDVLSTFDCLLDVGGDREATEPEPEVDKDV